MLDSSNALEAERGSLRCGASPTLSLFVCRVASLSVGLATLLLLSSAHAQSTLTIETAGFPSPETPPTCFVTGAGESSLEGSAVLGQDVVLDGVEDGLVGLIVRAEGFEQLETETLVAGDSSTFVELYADGNHEFSGLLINEAGAPVAGAAVVVQGVGPGRTGIRLETVSDSEGAYSFPAVPVGRYDVEFRDSVAELVRRDVLVTGTTRLDGLLIGEYEEPSTSTSRGCASAAASSGSVVLALAMVLGWTRRRW